MIADARKHRVEPPPPDGGAVDAGALQQSAPAASRVRAVLELVRLPTMTTGITNAVAGVVAGAVAAGGGVVAYQAGHASLETGSLGGVAEVPWGVLGRLMVVSAGTVLAGMAFNDVADRARDRVRAPGRPIPRGAITPRAGAIIAGLLMALSVGVAATISLAVLLVAVALAACVLAYDFLPGKERVRGVSLMALCRGLNASLGVVAIVDPFASGAPATLTRVEAWLYPVALLVWIFAITLISTLEDDPHRRGRLAIAALLGLASLVTPLVVFGVAAANGGLPAGENLRPVLGLGMACWTVLVLMLLVGRRIGWLAWRPTPRNAGLAVKWGVLGVTLFDGAIVAALGFPLLGAATALMLPVSLLLGRWLPKIPVRGPAVEAAPE